MRLEEMQAALASFEKDSEYSGAHYEDFLRRYPDQWVAVYEERFVAADPSLERLVTILLEKGVPPEHASVNYLATRDEILLLPG